MTVTDSTSGLIDDREVLSKEQIEYSASAQVAFNGNRVNGVPVNLNAIAAWFDSSSDIHSTGPAQGPGPADFFLEPHLLVSRLLENIDCGLKVLDLGCGYGLNSIMLSGETNEVWAIDIAQERIVQVTENINRANLSDRVFVRCMDAHNLDFPNDWFDLILANSVLLWVDKERVLQQCKRVLKPGGRILFSMETMAENPVLKLHRLRPSKRKRESMVCRLDLAAIRLLSSRFSSARSWQFHLLSPVLYPMAKWKSRSQIIRSAIKKLQRVDALLLERFPRLRRYAWVTVLEFTK
ncbi:MAG TPA: class I SAM-dependent methyltransferase [Candidatus Solibacter sp.]|jgi:ubiquinone/menaquinone biosynthesis C-methylase UbiE|nr:class I SAM-dependent methyltransferase [Candidatus Solibacter sp.]